MSLKKEIINKFRGKGYRFNVYFESANGEYGDVYYLNIMEDDVDDYVWQMLEELNDEYGLSWERHYTEGDYEVWELIE
jgi:hypothetical protein